MKNILLGSAMISVILFACKKDNFTTQPNKDQKFPVRIAIERFTQTSEDFDGRKKSSTNAKDAADSLADYIQHLYYLVYNNSNTLVKRINQTTADSSFGLIQDSLAAGHYTIALVGSKNETYIGGDPLFHFQDELAFFDFPGGDVFYKKTGIDVTDSIAIAVNMDRVVSKLKVQIQDAIPTSVKNISIQPTTYPLPPEGVNAGIANNILLYSGTSSAFSGGAGFYSPYYFPVPDSLHGTTNLAIEMYVLILSPATISVIIRSLDASYGTITEKDVTQVNIQSGKKTVLKGNLFSDLPGEGKGVHVGLNDPGWSNDSTLVNF
ncbi:FimB/Mfa2 family fimbrial subunit [Chitinophaga sp. LS1]|uniref:FimB/Mfa2 family fimbrial subunit n=1 Tax=Chitinophaga sp. LS1 TaxID=3051176 RepID=UPI002AABE142|nr:FimB/Mfa2 family fimbrial subunit [Chitinophaga sp. LS1]WPV64463.1 hypothetical protein QQL36_21920 [Chitinophaga sp. LS1]